MGELMEEYELHQIYAEGSDLPIFPTGCGIASWGSDIIVSGGEYSLGRNSWNLNIYKLAYATGKCEVLGRLSQPRRHHSCLVIGDWMYLLGGFNRMRVKLDSLVKINLSTAEEVECSALPVPMFKAAVTYYQEDLVVYNNGKLLFYSP